MQLHKHTSSQTSLKYVLMYNSNKLKLIKQPFWTKISSFKLKVT